MAFDEKDNDTTVYLVLMNCEEQYSLWPKSNTVPNGWTVMKEGSRAECGAYVNEVWTDMRPLSLRKHMEEFARKNAAADAEPSAESDGEPSAEASPIPGSDANPKPGAASSPSPSPTS